MLCFPRRACFVLAALLCASLPAGEAGGEPGIPQDLRVTPHGPSTVLLTWMKPSSNDVDHYLVYVEGEDLEHTTHNTFFALDGLAASTAYTFGVRTVSASAVMSEPALVDGQTSVDSTAEDKPDPPQNIRVSPQGYSGMLVLWDKSSSSDVDHYYVYVEGTGLEGKTSNGDVTFYIWEGLEPCTTYTFGVQTVSSSEVYSDPNEVDGETGANLPPAPQGLHVEKTTANAVTLAWEKPDTLCDISQYKVVTHQENGDPLKEDIVTETTAEVSELEPGTSYTFKVSAWSSTGEGPATSITGTTELRPGKPQNLDANAINSSAIYVTWSAPQLPPSYYLITAYEAGIFEDYIPVDTHYRLIGNLNPCTTCYITVTSYYEDEEQKRYEESTTGETDPNIPDPPEGCSVEAHESYISVTWDKPTSYCALGPYSVDYTVKKLWGNFEEESYNDTTLGNSYVVQDKPLPYHSYTFEIAASVEGMFGDSISCSGTSLETIAGPPVLVSVVSEAEGEVQVTWEPPAEENGQIIGYGIFVNDNDIADSEVSGEVRTTTVPLEKCVSVDIAVAARNHADYNDGWGNRSDAKSVTPAGDVVPDDVECRVFGADVQACWLPKNKSCPVSQYNIKWDGVVLWSPGNKDSGSATLDWTKGEICYTISTVPYTEYTISLNVGKNTEVPVTCSVTSPMAAPGPPTLEELQVEDLTIIVTWKEPLQKNGVISNYSVEWTDWNGEINSHVTDGDTSSYQIMLNSCGGEVGVTVSAKTAEFDDFGERSPSSSILVVSPISDLSCEAKAPGELELVWELQNSNCPGHFYNVTWSYASLWSDDKGSGMESFDGSVLSATLENLEPYSEVSVVVHVENSLQAAICNATTQQEAPGPPTLDELQVDNLTISVTWKEPQEKNGIISNYRVEWTDWNDKVNSKVTDGNTFLYEIMLNSCGGEVDVTVSAKTAGFEDFGERSQTRSASFANTVLNLTCESTSPGEVALSWMVPESKCPIYLYNVTWSFTSLWSEDEGSGWEAVERNVSSVTLESLPPYSDVSVALHVANSGPAPNCTTTTLEETSSAPRNLQQIAKELHSITVEWSLPEFSRGKLSGWYLYWTSAIGHFLGEQDMESPEERALEIASLEPSEVYYVHVMAVNGAGRGEEAVVEATTEYVPGRGGGGGGGHAVF